MSAANQDLTPDALSAALEHRVLRGAGTTPPADRAAAAAVARGEAASFPEPLKGYLEKVARHAYRVTAEDVAALKAAGLSEEAIFELTVATAVGAGRHRLARGLEALKR